MKRLRLGCIAWTGEAFIPLVVQPVDPVTAFVNEHSAFLDIRQAAAAVLPPAVCFERHTDEAEYMKRRRSRSQSMDVALSVALVAGSFTYFAALPRQLNPADEAIYLYEAKRILQGQVMYRDIFEIIPPGWMYLMAVLFWLFGTTITTARLTMAAIHALTSATIYATGRGLGVRPMLAIAAGVGYLALGPPAWQMASQHWLSTLLCTVLLLVATTGDRTRRRTVVAMGVVLGLLMIVQHPRGIMMAVGAVGLLAIDALARHRLRGEVPAVPIGKPASPSDIEGGGADNRNSVLVQGFWLGCGVAFIVAPLFVVLIASAGLQPIWQALVIHPLYSYAPRASVEWGNVNVMTLPQASYTFPYLLKWFPLILLVTVPRLIAAFVRRDASAIRTLAPIVAFCLSAMASIAYFPDFIHIAFIAPLFVVAVAEAAEWLMQQLPGSSWLAAALSSGVAGVVLLASARHLQHNFERLQSTYAFSRQTAFGEVAFQTEKDALLYDRINALLRDVPARDLFCYPIISHLYLLADANNPTRFGFLLAGYSTPDQIREVLGVLADRKPPYVVSLFPSLPDDPIVNYIQREYQLLPDGDASGNVIYRRADAARSVPAS